MDYKDQYGHVLTFFYNNLCRDKTLNNNSGEYCGDNNIFKNIITKSFKIFDYFIEKGFFKYEDLFKECGNCYKKLPVIMYIFETIEITFFQYLETKFKNINIDYIDKKGKSFLFYLVKKGIYRSFRTYPIYGRTGSKNDPFWYNNELINKGKLISIIYNDNGNYEKRKEFIKYLILEGININILDNHYKTALDYQYEIVDKFNYPDEVANIDKIISKNGFTKKMKKDYILEKEKEIVKLLRKHGAKRGCELLNKKCEREMF